MISESRRPRVLQNLKELLPNNADLRPCSLTVECNIEKKTSKGPNGEPCIENWIVPGQGVFEICRDVQNYVIN